MADPRLRADLLSRITAPDTWDAGLHAESDAGPIDVGLSVEPTALGVLIDAPGVGQLRVAFDVTEDGTTRLSRASRLLSDGREAPMIAVDEAKVLQLEGELERLRRTFQAVQTELGEQLGHLTTERDEARDRAAILSDERKELQSEVARLERELSAAVAAAQAEKDARLEALADRDRARTEVDLRAGELADARTGREAADSHAAE
ncbi:MAG: hypothetical protein ACOZQL_02280, partial [Myxococcota bacterium]